MLLTFVKFGRQPQVERLLNKWNYIDQLHETWDDGKTALIVACIYGRRDIVALLCESGADINHGDIEGWTPLHYAAYYGQPQIAEILLKHGAVINTKTRKGHTPLKVVKGAPKEEGMKEGRAMVREILEERN